MCLDFPRFQSFVIEETMNRWSILRSYRRGKGRSCYAGSLLSKCYQNPWSGLGVMTTFVPGELKKMRAEFACKMSVPLPSDTAWSSSYDVFCAGGKKKDARRNVLQNECTITF